MFEHLEPIVTQVEDTVAVVVSIGFKLLESLQFGSASKSDIAWAVGLTKLGE
ncbi:hypothetical protein SERLA73DRAFT_138474 [Serpula lacrymans var. lacrymans S7.3]|uniref:Uncharacterized protein n=2 Tax=Serpula lacrymans var. lacrymans TaxID=341189 RepID=F8Q1I8_SERL3|nr:uncharacterized protein SERLADRAFT_392134 [Serpula lacrymans var. lacrymans S7.9]EGN98166.1 hypothetical protein SERLA73DRAFT_138474 [Serpula lacrymans var. lacrymans S7.3]EGO23743.1 hypothetical protein SERLADRAFT_392134 [Serpula lacrymans var. lacrymans S7.9]